jgi:hypothetical protein
MAEITIGLTSGKYVGNGSSQDIVFSSHWKNLTIMDANRKYIMTFFKNNSGQTIGQAAIGSGGSFKQLTIVEGGITELPSGFQVGSHVSINELDTEYFWSVS